MTIYVLQFSTGVLALSVLVFYLDRVRMMRWRTHLWRVVGMHLLWALWLGFVGFDALLNDGPSYYDIFGVFGAAMWLATSRSSWRQGPPRETESAPVPLGPPETANAPLRDI
jgi:hypothetical protein